MSPAMRLTRMTSPFWAPVVVGILAGLMLWMTGLDAALGAEEGAEEGAGTANDGESRVMITFEAVEGYAPNTPMYLVADMERSMAFYVEAFGLTLGSILRDDNGAAFHGDFSVNGETILMIGPESADEGGGESPHGVSPNTGGYDASFNGYLYVSDVDGFVARAVENGAEMLEEPTDQFWGDRTSYLKDPDGYLWMIATKIVTETE